MNLFDRLGGRKLDIILVYQKLVFVTQTGRYTSREQILEDLAKYTTQYGDMMRNECKIFADKYQVVQLEEYKCEPSSLDIIMKPYTCIWSHLCLHIEYHTCDTFD